MAGLHGTHDILAPAKINLHLHVTGRLDDGFHTLDSLVAFADIGDRIVIEPSASFEFHVTGPFAEGFSPEEKDAGPHSRNLAVRAARDLATATGRDAPIRIMLQKNLPLASGIGGGSADAAAVLWGLTELWQLPSGSASWLPALAAGLGSDVPACLRCRPVRMRGIGEILEDGPEMPEIPVLLIHPGQTCPTAEVYSRFKGPFLHDADLSSITGFESLVERLRQNHNSLTEPAVSLVPEIAFVLEALNAQAGCRLARMSGSGATCFGLFDDSTARDAAESVLKNRHPGWWIRSGMLNRPVRY